MAPLPTKPTMVEKEEKEKKEEDEQNLKEKANPGTLVVVEPMKKGGNCGVIGPGLLDVFLRLGFLKVVSVCLSLKYIDVQDISQNLSPIVLTKI